MRMALVRYRYADPPLRLQNRAAHVARLRELAAQGVVVAAGPEDDDGGAVLVLAVQDVAAACALMDADPYVRSGAVRDYSVESFDAVVVAPGLLLEESPDRARPIT